MAENKTQPTGASVADFLDSVAPPIRQQQAREMDALFREATGWEPRLWGPSIVGYGRYDYSYDSGRSGQFLATGFAPRKAQIVVYILPGYADFGAVLARLGPHKLGKSCLYLSRPEQVDRAVLIELIRAGLADLASRWPVHPI